jgi:amidase
MAVYRPNVDEVLKAADELGLHLSKADALSFHALMQGQLDASNIVDELVAPLPEVKYPRTPGVRPGREENPYGAWAVETRIRGAGNGKLSGKRAAITFSSEVVPVSSPLNQEILQRAMPSRIFGVLAHALFVF